MKSVLTSFLFLSTVTITTTMSVRFRTIDRVLPRPSTHWVGDGFQGEFSFRVQHVQHSRILLFYVHRLSHTLSRFPNDTSVSRICKLGVHQDHKSHAHVRLRCTHGIPNQQEWQAFGCGQASPSRIRDCHNRLSGRSRAPRFHGRPWGYSRRRCPMDDGRKRDCS